VVCFDALAALATRDPTGRFAAGRMTEQAAVNAGIVERARATVQRTSVVLWARGNA
jgi:hypothetical protein